MKYVWALTLIVLFVGCVELFDETEQNTSVNTGQEFDEPKIENIGIEIDFYDPSTNKAGDFSFHTFTYSWSDEVYNQKLFYDYGDITYMDDGTIVLEPQPIFILPLGTKVLAITSGEVSDIKKLYSDDYTIMVIKPENPDWVYEHEHVINPLVKVGDTVFAGQIIAEVSDYNQWLRADGYGVLDIGILTTSDDGSPLHLCPFMYLDESVKPYYLERINALYNSWEEYTGNSSLYAESENVIPGCITIEPIAR